MDEKEEERISREEGVEDLILQAYASIQEGDTASAQRYLKEALKADFEHPEVLYALKCLTWWLEKLRRLDDFNDPCEKGEYILSLFKFYYVFLERIKEAGVSQKPELPKESVDSCQYALKRFVFSRALDCYRPLLGEGTNQQDPGLLLQAGRCCKGAGEWEEALGYLEQAGRFRRDDSAILSELADVNALLGNDRAAKVLFREAFFLDSQGIDLMAMESELIIRLCDKIREFGYSGQELAEWVPVWGYIWGIFSIKRELKPVELGRLKQSILSLENEHRSQSAEKKGSGSQAAGSLSERNLLIKPRLLNRYFWLIDNCEYNRDTSGLKDETMLKIKFIDPVVYEAYRT